MLTHKLDHGPLTSTSPLVHHAQNSSKQAYPHRLYFLPPAKAGSVSPTYPFATFEDVQDDLGMGQNPIPLVNIKIAGKWMFIPLKMVCIGIDP